ncbi:hypothetical protein B0T17DRAFT_619725 [Bombardia bombarda]|uniref:Uncharacterized protein n=1 Tax=Bombardia bombarda TaxID=252184 RepID=A0AA40BV69_9PEZI|nr:hypothetical protein B0T17DRAFT_619725 [Bombardia bombarda]
MTTDFLDVREQQSSPKGMTTDFFDVREQQSSPKGMAPSSKLPHHFKSVMGQAECRDREEGGVIVILPSRAVTGNDLRQTLETVFPSQYSIQLKLDKYRVTLPKLNRAQLEQYFPTIELLS